jgi:hypothetical protein
MIDTPRTDAAYFKPHSTKYDLAGEMKRIERELNAANADVERLTKANLQLREGCEGLKQRIKRLEELGDKMEIYCDTILARDWKEAKEAKP